MTAVRRVLRLAWFAVVFELNIYKSLGRWVLRHPSVPQGHEPAGYAQLSTPVIALWIFGSALELPLVHVLVPWPAVRIALLVVGVWGLLWMVGLLAGLRSYPHLLGPAVLRVRSGPLHDIAIPWSAVSSVTTGDRSLPSSMWTLQAEEAEGGTHLNVTVSGRVNIHLALREPLALSTHKGEMTVAGVSLWADDPREVATRIRAEVSTH